MRLQLWLLPFLVLMPALPAAWPSASFASEAITVLAPDSPPVASPEQDEEMVPPLHVEVPEALGKSGLALDAGGRHLWHRDAEDDSPFRLAATVDPGRFDHGLLTAWNADNEAIHRERIEPGKTRDLVFRIDGYGSYLLTLDGISGGEARKRLVRNIARTPDLSGVRETFRTEEFFLGICAFPGRYHWKVGGRPVLPPGLSEERARDLEADLLARAGFQVVRVDESMEMGKRTPGQGHSFDFDRMDAAVEAYVSRGFDLALQLMHAPDWATAPKYAQVTRHRWRYPREEAAQRAYVAALLERYGEHARFVQIFNEPDQVEFWAGTPGEFVEQFRATREEIREHSEDLPIANGGYAFVDEGKVRFFAEHLRPFLDRPSYHSHGTFPAMREAFGRMKAIHREAGYADSAFLNTETGFDAWRLDQERRQAQALVQKTLYCWAHDHRGVLLFCGRMLKGPGREGRDLGLLDHEFCPRFSYAAVTGLVSVLAGASFEGTLLENEEACLYQFRRGNDLIVAGFSLEEGERFVLETDAASVIPVDAMGNRGKREVSGEASVFVLEADAYPSYLILEDANSAGLRSPEAELDR